MYACVFVCVVFVLRPLLFPYRWGRMRALNSASEIDQDNLTHRGNQSYY